VVVSAVDALPVVADPVRLGQAFLNLAENAVRHAVSGKPVTIRGFRTGADAAIEIANAGPPIPAEELPRLFERFAQGGGAERSRRTDDTRTAGPEGAGHAGLGLPIARAIVEASGGRIDAASDEAGTRFTILLPLLEPADSQHLLSEQRTLPA
jgi:signal transduction histidine kinase